MTDIETRMVKLEQRVQTLEKLAQVGLLFSKNAPVHMEEELAEQYGRYVNKSTAASILGVTRATVYAMLADGHIKGAYEGMYVDVRSIAEYMCAMKPKKRRNANEQGIFDRQSDR